MGFPVAVVALLLLLVREMEVFLQEMKVLLHGKDVRIENIFSTAWISLYHSGDEYSRCIDHFLYVFVIGEKQRFAWK